jgi:multidrug efflux pump subunit AcrB|tara:strand:+ start:3017 stop:3157 length:141 start_codon:yes stop_codon:yes gene_type:complete
MLFRFGNFWKIVSSLIGFWVAYGIFGFEFTTITLLALIFAAKMQDI